jgi:IS30 family transposase
MKSRFCSTGILPVEKHMGWKPLLHPYRIFWGWIDSLTYEQYKCRAPLGARASRPHALELNPVRARRPRSKKFLTAFQSAYQAFHEMPSSIPPMLRRTITYDNGLENTLHGDLNAAFAMRSFFCAPYHSWEKGTVENTNGLVRRYLPKRTNYDMLHDEHIEQIEDRLNSRPRKCLDFKTSAEAYNDLIVASAG